MKRAIFSVLLICVINLSAGLPYKTGFMSAERVKAFNEKSRLERLASDCMVMAERNPMLAPFARDVQQDCTELNIPDGRFLCDQAITTFHTAYVAIH